MFLGPRRRLRDRLRGKAGSAGEDIESLGELAGFASFQLLAICVNEIVSTNKSQRTSKS